MKIIINSAHQRFGGGVQVALSFIYEYIKYVEHEYHVFAGPGVKIYGEITIANNIKIAPNAAVIKRFIIEIVVIGGVPTKIIRS